MDFAYHSTLALRAERRSLLFRIAVTEHCVFSFLSIFISALIGGRVEYFPVFEDATALEESGILLPSPVGVHPYLADVGLFSVS